MFLTIEVTQQLTPTLVSSGPIVSLCFLSAIQETKGFELFQVTQTFANLLSLKETPLVKEFKFMFLLCRGKPEMVAVERQKGKRLNFELGISRVVTSLLFICEKE